MKDSIKNTINILTPRKKDLVFGDVTNQKHKKKNSSSFASLNNKIKQNLNQVNKNQ